MHVVLAGVGIGDLGLEEFLPGELGVLAGDADDLGGMTGGDQLRLGWQLGLRLAARTKSSRSNRPSLIYPPALVYTPDNAAIV